MNEILIGIFIGIGIMIIVLLFMVLFSKVNHIEREHNKLKENMGMVISILEKIPSPEQLAKEILKVKLPLTDLPKEALESLKGSIDKKLDEDSNNRSINKDKKKTASEQHSYFG